MDAFMAPVIALGIVAAIALAVAVGGRFDRSVEAGAGLVIAGGIVAGIAAPVTGIVELYGPAIAGVLVGSLVLVADRVAARKYR